MIIMTGRNSEDEVEKTTAAVGARGRLISGCREGPYK